MGQAVEVCCHVTSLPFVRYYCHHEIEETRVQEVEYFPYIIVLRSKIEKGASRTDNFFGLAAYVTLIKSNK